MIITDTIDFSKVTNHMLELGRRAIERAGYYMADRMHFYVPVDTGHLFDTIIVEVNAGSESVYVMATAVYAAAVEWGHYTRSGSLTLPNPYFRKSINDTIRDFPAIAHAAESQGIA